MQLHTERLVVSIEYAQGGVVADVLSISITSGSNVISGLFKSSALNVNTESLSVGSKRVEMRTRTTHDKMLITLYDGTLSLTASLDKRKFYRHVSFDRLRIEKETETYRDAFFESMRAVLNDVRFVTQNERLAHANEAERELRRYLRERMSDDDATDVIMTARQHALSRLQADNPYSVYC